MSSKFNVSTELLEQFKEMQFITSEKDIIGMCGDNTQCLYSIGDNGDLNLFCQADNKATGWEKITISEGISTLNKNEITTIKHFCAQKKEKKFHVVAIGNHDNKDDLFISSTEDQKNPKWEKIEFDDPSVQMSCIKNVFTCSYQDKFATIADIEQPNGHINRYYINNSQEINNEKKWAPHPLPADYDNTVNTCMGRKKNETIPGTYTFGNLGTTQQIIYTPLFNIFDPNIPPTSVRINIPTKIDVMTTQKTKDDYTNLFLCGNGKLYVSKFDNQKDGSEAVQIVESDEFYGVKNLHAYRVDKFQTIVVWGLNAVGNLFYCHCNETCIDDPNCWSKLFIHLENVAYYCAYFNEITGAGNLITYHNDGSVFLRTQAAFLSQWDHFSISLPTSGKSQKFNSYTTKITVTDENGKTCPNKEFWLESSDYYSVYINNLNHTLNKDPIKVKTDSKGVIKIVQHASSLSSCEFTIYENENNDISEKIHITPSDHVTDKLIALNTEASIKNAKIIHGDGSSEYLVGKDINGDLITAVAKTMPYMANAKKAFQNPDLAMHGEENEFKGIFVSVGKNHCQCYTDKEALIKAAESNMIKGINIQSDGSILYDHISVNASQTTDSLWDDICEAIDYIKHSGEEIWNYSFEFIKSAYHFFVKIGEKTYHFVINSFKTLANGLEIAWNAIKVFTDKLLDFLDVVFDWKNIKKTADIIKHLFNLQLNNIESSIDKLQYDTKKITEKVKKAIDDWAGINNIEDFNNTSIQNIPNCYPQIDNNSIQNSYSADYFTENTSRCSISEQFSYINELPYNESGISDFINKEKKILNEFYEKIRDVIKDIPSMDFLTLTKKIIALITDEFIETAENGVLLVLDLTKNIIEQLKQALSTPIQIPVLSNILEEWFGVQPFSLLDIIAFVTALPSNMIYKLITQKSISDEYDGIMAIGANKNSTLQLPNIPDKYKNTVCIIGHTVGAVTRTIEIAVYPLSVTAEEAEFEELDYICIGLVIVSAASDKIADYVYKPHCDQDLFLPFILIVKYLPLGINFIAKKKAQKEIEEFAAFFYEIGCFADIGCCIYNIVDTVNEKKNPERAIGIVELCGKICGDFGDFLDQIIKYDKEPESKLAFLVTREVLIGAAVVMDYATAISIYKNKLPILL